MQRKPMSHDTRWRQYRRPISRNAARCIARLALILLLASCTPTALLPEASVAPTTQVGIAPTLQPPDPTAKAAVTAEDAPTATVEGTPFSGGKSYRNSDLGVTLRY